MGKVDTSYIERIQRQLILHSFIYYRFNTSIWTDEQFDKAAYLLVSLEHTEEFKTSKFYDVFKDWDGSTGYHLLDMPSRTYWCNLAQEMLNHDAEQ